MKQSPPYFNRLFLKNVRCFAEAEIPLDPRMTVIIGGNGAGKTTIVECLASMTHGDEEGLITFPFRRKTKSGEMALYDQGSTKPAATWKGATRKRLPPSRYLLAYGRYRRVFDPDEQKAPQTFEVSLTNLESHAHRDRTTTLRRPDNNLYADLSQYLVTLHEARSEARMDHIWLQLNKSLSDVGQSISGIEVIVRDGRNVPMVLRHGLHLELGELSDGYQALLVIIFDLILRYAFLFPQLDKPLEGAATVVIDEVDLHLHPRWQRTVIQQLMTLFPNTQFVITTHSPSVLQGVLDMDGGSVIVLDEDQKTKEAKPRSLTRKFMQSLKGAEVGSLLVEDKLFDLPSRYSPEQGEVEKTVDELQAKVKKGVATDTDHQELSKHLQHFQQLVSDEDKRRADTSQLSKLTSLQTDFAKSLIKELRDLKKGGPK